MPKSHQKSGPNGKSWFIALQEVQTVENDLPKFMEWVRRAIRLSEEDAA